MDAMDPQNSNPCLRRYPRRAPGSQIIPNTGKLREDRGLTATIYNKVQYVCTRLTRPVRIGVHGLPLPQSHIVP